MSATNTFDFIAVKATHKNKTPLKALSRSIGRQIESKYEGRHPYGQNWYPRYSHFVSLGWVDVAGKTPSSIADEIASLSEPAISLGLSVSSTYRARD